MSYLKIVLDKHLLRVSIVKKFLSMIISGLFFYSIVSNSLGVLLLVAFSMVATELIYFQVEKYLIRKAEIKFIVKHRLHDTFDKFKKQKVS